MTTRIESSRNLVNQEFIQFIRPQLITLSLIEARPNTKMYVFFGSEDVTYLCNQPNQPIGTTLITDGVGQAVIQLNIPGGKFNVGTYNITVTDSDDLQVLETLGSVFGSATGTFSSTGRVDIFQNTEVSFITVTRTQNIQLDPLAQSFFTFGVDGGLFLSSIEVYFQTKDPDIPVRCELRRLENGLPAKIDLNNPYLISVLSPQNVVTSTDASVSSKFVFDPPVYLEGESDFCFVLRSNSNRYNVFTSRMGEVSIEDGRTIFDQPYIGSIFKSENNVTWTAEQFEDIKFKINKAVFSTTPATVDFAAVVPQTAASGTQFSTANGSNIITYVHQQDHGLEVGSKFNVIAWTDAKSANSSYNGISPIQFNTTHNVLSVADRKTLTFQVSSNATSSGPINTARTVTHVTVLSTGSNYSANDTITITGGGGTGAKVNPVIYNGQITGLIVEDGGSNYTGQPTANVITTTGFGASFVVSTEPRFTVSVNKPMTGFIPKINSNNLSGTSTKTTISTTIGNYEFGNLVTYNPGKTTRILTNYPYVNIGQNSVIASRFNEDELMGGNRSARISMELSTINPNLTPSLDLRSIPTLHAYYHLINNQRNETLTSSNSSGSIQSFVVTSPGSSYTLAPLVTISAPELPGGIQATANTTITANAVTSVNIIEPGSGYTSTPTVVISPAPGDITGSGAAAQALLFDFNTELLPSGGTAKSRYITKINSLKIISTGMRLFCVLSSVPGSYVDWYVRTSLSGSGTDHESENWRRLSCDVERNRSSFVGQMLEYEFFINNLSEFDTYDLKCVLGADDPTKSPIVNSYRVIVAA